MITKIWYTPGCFEGRAHVGPDLRPALQVPGEQVIKEGRGGAGLVPVLLTGEAAPANQNALETRTTAASDLDRAGPHGGRVSVDTVAKIMAELGLDGRSADAAA